MIQNGNIEQLASPTNRNQQPIIKEIVLPKGRSKLVFYSSELGKYFSDEDITKAIHLWEIDNEGKDDPEAIGKVLLDEAIQRAKAQGKELSGDITAMVINFDLPEKGVIPLADRRQRKARTTYGRGFPKAA